MLRDAIIRRVLSLILRLPPRTCRKVVAEPLAMPMRDGVELLADRYFSPDLPTAPVVLIRSPYGRSSMFAMIAGLFAERGFQVVSQSVRGTSGSGGTFDPMRREKDDGADTLDWVRAQPWFGGKLFTWGMSYLGFTQWAMAAAAPDKLDGLSLGVTLSNFRDEMLGFGGFAQAGLLTWTGTMLQVMAGGMRRQRPPDLSEALAQLPVGTMDEAAYGKDIYWWREWCAHDDPLDPWWQPTDHSAGVPELAAPTSMIAGWQDIFTPHQLRDFAARQAAGKPAWITVGPWNHVSLGNMAEGIRGAIDFYTALRDGRAPHADRDRVRLYVQGLNKWQTYSHWPPEGSRPLQLHLHPEGRLAQEPCTADAALAHYVYDPADPTPSLHGPALMGGAKLRDMTALEARRDTVSFTMPSLEADCTVIGPVSAELVVQSDRDHTDFFVCLCDVDAKGRPIQVCDGYIRLRPDRPARDARGTRRITIECWPTAWQFKQGHSLRLIVASGAHPRFARNLGTGESLATATAMVPARQAILAGSSLSLFTQ